jgi:hypothetical protein
MGPFEGLLKALVVLGGSGIVALFGAGDHGQVLFKGVRFVRGCRGYLREVSFRGRICFCKIELDNFLNPGIHGKSNTFGVFFHAEEEVAGKSEVDVFAG